MDLYAGKKLRPLRIQYKDYAQWQNDQKEKERLKKQEEYWFNLFEADVPVLNLPTDYPRPDVQSFEGYQIGFVLARKDTKQLKELAAIHGATLYMVLLAIFNVLLAKLSGQENIVVGTPIAGRRHTELEHIIGMFVNTLALRNLPSPEKTFNAFLKEVKQRTLDAFENQEYQIENLVRKVTLDGRITRDAGRNPLFDVVFSFQNINLPEIEIPGLRLKPYEFEYKISHFDLTLYANEINDSIAFSLEYSTALFKKETIEKMRDYYIDIVKQVLENENIKLKEITVSYDLVPAKANILQDKNGVYNF
jgi:non-ribosomal peptide synthetase component F